MRALLKNKLCAALPSLLLPILFQLVAAMLDRLFLLSFCYSVLDAGLLVFLFYRFSQSDPAVLALFLRRRPFVCALFGAAVFVLLAISEACYLAFSRTAALAIFLAAMPTADRKRPSPDYVMQYAPGSNILKRFSDNVLAGGKQRSISNALEEDEKWLDLLEQGYFLCDKDLKLIYSNKRGQQLLQDIRMDFRIFSQKLLETQEPHQSLHQVIVCLLDSGIEGGSLKAEFGFVEDSGREDSPSSTSFKAGLCCNYKINVWRLKANKVLLIVKERNQFGTLVFADKLNQAATCTLSHELKTLLNAIIGNLNLLEDGVDKEHSLFYRLAYSSSQVLSCRLNDLFDYLQIQQKTFKLHQRVFSLDELMKEITATCEGPASQKQLKFTVEKEESLPDRLLGDPVRTKQILLNLLSKAIEYTDYGAISMLVQRKQGNAVAFKVRSVGFGMHYKLLTHIQASSPKSRKQRYSKMESRPEESTQNIDEMCFEISNIICKEMGSCIIVKSTEKGSSQFSFRLADAIPAEKEAPQSCVVKGRSLRPQLDLDLTPSANLNIGRHSLGLRSQCGLDKVVNCGKIENFNIINLNVASSPGANFADVFAPLLAQRSCINESEDAQECEVPPDCSVTEHLSVSYYALPPKKPPSHIRLRMPSATLPVATSPTAASASSPHNARMTERPQQESRRDILGPVKLESRLPAPRREKTRRTTMQGGNEAARFRPRLAMQYIDDYCSYHVLIVDDNASNRFVLKSMLMKQKYTSIEAQDGADAVNVVGEYIKSGAIKELFLIFMDLQMPIMNGIEATSRIITLCEKSGVQAPPIVGVSSDPSADDREKFEAAGISEFVSKPLDMHKVKCAIKCYIECSHK